jgi:hypothetical protein
VPVIHIANTSFEEEIEKGIPFPQSMLSHPMYLQLQFLPFLYADENDLVFTTEDPESSYFEQLKALGLPLPRIIHNPTEGSIVNCWGTTSSLYTWAKENRLTLDGPSPEIVKRVNSKAFSFLNAPKLEHGALLHNWEELCSWFGSFSGKKVLKTCFGVSGKGHFHLSSLNDPSLLAFAQREWDKKLPLIAEPWVARLFDFSTQWFLHKNGRKEFFGYTVCENDTRGHYIGTVVGTKEPVELNEHLKIAHQILDAMMIEGYFGHVGFDAMVFGDQQLQPIVEINGRKTMGWVAIALHNRYFRNRAIAIRLVKRTQKIGSLLPVQVNKICFQKQLCVDFIEK